MRQSSLFSKLLLGVGLALAAGAAAADPATQEQPAPQSYPYDPVCRWGRLADGHGMLTRCLTEAEAVGLSKQHPATAAEKPPPAKGEGPSQPEQPAALPNLTARVAGVQVDTGALPLAASKLGKSVERYVGCVHDNGGLSEAKGIAKIRFLVRERGRAEGVGVREAKGMTQAAAKCIAAVVDRRFVGYPAAAMVGTTVVIEVSPKK